MKKKDLILKMIIISYIFLSAIDKFIYKLPDFLFISFAGICILFIVLELINSKKK